MPSSSSESPAGELRLVCRCIGVSSLRIEEAIRSQGLSRLDQVQDAVQAGTGCGTCHPEIEELLSEGRGESVSNGVRAKNRAVCRAETERHIEGSLYSRILPELSAGTRIELVWVEGLRVELRVTPPLDPALRQTIAAKLRKFICPDLEVTWLE